MYRLCAEKAGDSVRQVAGSGDFLCPCLLQGQVTVVDIVAKVGDSPIIHPDGHVDQVDGRSGWHADNAILANINGIDNILFRPGGLTLQKVGSQFYRFLYPDTPGTEHAHRTVEQLL